MRFNFHLTDTARHFTVMAMAILEKDSKILLVQDTTKQYYGRWTLPAIICRADELLVSAAERAVQQVTGLKAQTESIVNWYHQYDEVDRIGYLLPVFIMKDISGEINLDASRALNAEWFTYNQIFHMPKESFRFPHIRNTIKEYRKGTYYPLSLIKEV